MNKKELNNLFGHTLVETGRQIKMYNLNMFKEKGYDITPEQFVILSFLEDNSNLHQMQLCELLYKDRSNMARLIGVLEKKGLVKKLQSISNIKHLKEKKKKKGLVKKLPSIDKRLVNKIQITEKGKKLKEIITPDIMNSRKNFLNKIPVEDLNCCIDVLLKIQHNLKTKKMTD